MAETREFRPARGRGLERDQKLLPGHRQKCQDRGLARAAKVTR